MNIYIVNCFDTYEHRVDLLYDVFVKQGHSVKVITSDYKHIDKEYRSDNKENFRYIHAHAYYKNLSTDRLYSHYKLAKDIFTNMARNHKVDLVWVLVPPNSFVKEAALYKKQSPKVKLIFDFIDLWPETMPISRFKNLPPFIYWKNLRDKYIDAADHIVTECNLYQEKIPKSIDRTKITTLYLARQIRDIDVTPNLPDDRISLCYLGSINNIIDIDKISDIISGIKEHTPVDLHIIGEGEKKDELISKSMTAGANVVYHGKIYDEVKKSEIMNQCHYGLNIMKESVFVGLTMKSIDYFEHGLPIINNIKGDTWKFVSEFEIGVNVDSEIKYSEYINIQNRNRVRSFFEEFLSVDSFKKELMNIDVF